MKEQVKILKALANERRLKTLKYLKKRNAPVFDIANAIRLSYKSTSRHLNVLYAAGILERQQILHEMHYFLSSKQNNIVKLILSSQEQ